MMNNKWMVLGLGACIGLGGLMASCGDDSKETEKDTPSLRFLQSSAQIKKGDTESIQVEYKINNVGKDGAVIGLTHSNPGCITIPENVATGAGGIASIKIVAGDTNCESDVTAKSPDAEPITRTLKIVVAEKTIIDDPIIVVPGIPVITVVNPANKQLYIDVIGASGKIDVLYADGKVAVADAQLKVKSSDSSCASVQAASATTDAAGKATFKIIAAKVDCNANIEISSDTAKVLPVSVAVSTKKVVDFTINARAKMDSPKIADVSDVIIGYVDGNCDFLIGKPAEQFKLISFMSMQEIADVPSKIEGDYIQMAYTSFKNIPILGGKRAVVAYATVGKDGAVIATGCTADFDIENNEQDVNLIAVPTNFLGNYDLTANFDLTSGFAKTPGADFPVVEQMLAGDWVQFTADFFEKPIDVLLNLVWTNSIVRLKDMESIPEFIKKIITDGSMRILIVNALKPLITDYFKDSAWFTIFTKISPDIADLTKNMQFVGLMSVTEVNGKSVKQASQKYDAIQYRWSYDSVGCIPKDNVYGDAPCRQRLNLSKIKDVTIQGNWQGSIDESSDRHDGLLTISSHPITFKWASILYTVAFGEILPRAFGYSNYDSVKDGQYLKSLLEFFLFDKLNAYYAETNPEYDFDQTQSCERFIEVLLRLIQSSAFPSISESMMLSAIQISAPLACGENGIGKLEDLIQNSLNKVQATTNNGFMFSSDNCGLTAVGTNYDFIGNVDNPTYSTNSILLELKKPIAQQSFKTNRCMWDVNFTINAKPVKINALFHAKRK